MADNIGHWLNTLPGWLQLMAIPTVIVLALLFMPIANGDTLGTIILDAITKKIGGK